MKKTLRVLGLVLLVVLVLLGAFATWFYLQLRSSLPELDGEVALAGLAAPVTLERDARGVPTIRGASRVDVARATGFAHGQDRFFQMDLMRRQPAGELSELFGGVALEWDRGIRRHRFRARARVALAAETEEHRRILEAYAEGVNAGLGSLDAPPFEYLVLRSSPAPWRAEDSILVSYAMYIDLQDETGAQESAYGVMHDVLPAPLYDLLTPCGTEWDAPVEGEPLDVAAIPGPEVFDLRAQPPAEGAEEEAEDVAEARIRGEDASELIRGSNNWAVSGEHTTSGGALLANDMHLGHAVPNIWYRAVLVFPADGGERRMAGVTLPGTPVVVAGSNGEVAWGFTNSQGDWTDLVVLEEAGEDAYLAPDGPRPFEHHREEIRVHGGESEEIDVLDTIWGPVVDEDHEGRKRALRWVAHDVAGANLRLIDLETASTLVEAMDVANSAGAPAQNFTVASSGGRVGWTIMGRVPRRFGHDGRTPASWADGSRGWDGYLGPGETPRILDPEGGRIWTANARVVSGEDLAKLGDGGYDLGARARQIRDDLFAIERADERALLAVQLDDRALFLERWRGLLLHVLDEDAVAADARRGEMRALLLSWEGRASVGAVGYRLARAFRNEVDKRVFESLTASCKRADERFRYWRIAQREGPLWKLVSERPQHLLDPRFADWDELLLAAADAVLDGLKEPLAERTWGELNTVRVRHPLSRALPSFLGSKLDMAPTPLPGDSNMPRVQHVAFGASERIVVSPGHEEDGIFHMPTGQSGHPLSPHYGDGHADWMEGRPTPFLPGDAVHVLTLVPQ